MPRRNNRDKRYDPKDYETNQSSYGYEQQAPSKPRKRRKSKNDKKIYRDDE